MDREKFVKDVVNRYLHGWGVAFDLVGNAGYCDKATRTLHFHKGYVEVLPRTELLWLIKHEIAHVFAPHDPFTPAHNELFYSSLKKMGMSKDSDRRLECRLPSYSQQADAWLDKVKKPFWG